jgi:uncharacterized alpha-E superfamily protein
MLGARSRELEVLLRALEVGAELDAGALGGGKTPVRLERKLFERIVAPTPPRSLRAGIESAFRAGSLARERLSSDTWRVLNRLHEQVLDFELRQRLELGDALEALNRMVLGFSAFSGLVMENMTHNPGWRFADIGRRIERAFHVARLVGSTLVEADDNASFDGILEVADSTITYRSRYRGMMQFEPVLDLVLTDETNPRSVAYQLVALHDHIGSLPRTERHVGGLSPSARTALRALSSVRLAELSVLARTGPTGRRHELEKLCAGLEEDLPLLADQLTLSYLAHAKPSVSLGSMEEPGE